MGKKIALNKLDKLFTIIYNVCFDDELSCLKVKMKIVIL